MDIAEVLWSEKKTDSIDEEYSRKCTSSSKGPSIYDVHTKGGRGSGSDGRMWMGDGGPAPCGRPHRKLKLESTDVILSSSHAKKLASFYQNFVFGQKKVEIFLRYKLVI